jgi:hypothetical protein
VNITQIQTLLTAYDGEEPVARAQCTAHEILEDVSSEQAEHLPDFVREKSATLIEVSILCI